MLNLRKIAITGGLASGKTSVCEILQSLGAYIVSADELVHQLLSPHTELGKQIVEIFGHDIVKNERLDRTKIAERAFRVPEKLQNLEKILHPAVLQEIENRYEALVKTLNPPSLFVAEIPLLFEIAAEKMFDRVVVVAAPESICRKRFTTSSGHTTDQFMLRMQRQLPVDEKTLKADVVIMNDGSKEDLKKKVLEFYQTLITN